MISFFPKHPYYAVEASRPWPWHTPNTHHCNVSIQQITSTKAKQTTPLWLINDFIPKFTLMIWQIDTNLYVYFKAHTNLFLQETIEKLPFHVNIV